MSFRRRLGTALRNINDIKTVGYVKGDERPPEQLMDNDAPQALSIDDEEVTLGDAYPGWRVKTGGED